MSQPIENKRDFAIDLMDFLGSSVERSQSRYLSVSERALMSFRSFCGESEIRSETKLSATVRNWLVSMRIEGNSLTTAVRYLKAISGFYSKVVKEELVPSSDLFSSLMATLRAGGDELWNDNVDAGDFDRLIGFTKKSFHHGDRADRGADMIMFALLNGCMPIKNVAGIRIDSDLDLGSDSLELVRRNRESRRQYVFPLNQGDLTPRQFSAKLLTLVSRALGNADIRMTVSIDETLRSYWAYAALRAGFSPDTVFSYLGTAPRLMKILSLCEPVGLSDSERKDIAAATADIFVSNPLRWYAMRLRPRVSFKDLTERLGQLRDSTVVPQLFYPCTEIARRIGRRMVFENQPVIRDIVYFNCRATAIFPLFSRIGELAWCYKTGGKGGSGYAAISDSSFRRFQEAIGCFTPDYAPCFDDHAPLKEDDAVIISGGILDGCSGKLTKVIDDTPDGIIRYIVEISDIHRSHRIKAEIDSRQVKRKTVV